MDCEKYIGLDVHQATISVAVLDSTGKLVMESILETKAATILQFFAGLRGTLSVTFEEGTCAAWLYDLLKPHVDKLVVCNPRKNALLKDGNKSDRIDARKLAELLRGNQLKPLYHGETGVRMLRELARSYLTIVKDLSRVMNRLKALYRSWAIPCAGRDVTIDRIRMEGQPSALSTDFGYNVTNGVHYSGELPRSSARFDYYFLSGSFTVQSSFFNNLFVAVSQDAFSKSSHVTIGGSPSAGNHVENTCGGLDIETAENSVFEISYNESSGTCAGMWVVPTWVPFVPTSPSWYFINDNKFIGTGQKADGMYLLDDVTNPWIQAAVWNNTVRVKDILSEGMGAYNAKDTAIWNNIVTGTDGYDGIGLWSSTLYATHGLYIVSDRWCGVDGQPFQPSADVVTLRYWARRVAS